MASAFTLGETACREHLLTGHRITGVEASILFGVGLLSRLIARMRKEGSLIYSRSVSYAAIVERLAPHAKLVPPQNLPVRDIHFTEYWVSR